MDKKKRTWKLNLFDTGVLVLAVLAGAFLLWRNVAPAAGGDPAEGAQVSGSTTIRYEVELSELRLEAAQLVQVGDELIERTRKEVMGTVESVEVNPTRTLAKDQNTGNYFFAEIPERYTATMTVVASATVSDDRIVLDSGLEIRAGISVRVFGPNYYGTGHVTRVERG